MTDEDKAFIDSCNSFKDYGGIDEYIDDIRKCLVLSDWHYTEQRADERIEENRSYIKNAYSNREDAWSAAMEAGFCCG